MSHTPGEWTADDFNVYGPDGIAVAALSSSRLKAERVANGKLIAAAPELLAACKEITRRFVEVCPDESGHTYPFDQDRIDAANAVIAKAEGK